MSSHVSEDTSLSRHLDRIRRVPRLTHEEEYALAVRTRRGDADAKQELVRRHLPLAVSFARRQRRGALRLEDLIQEGSLGLLRAAESFDPTTGMRFSAYALWWIRSYVGKYLKEARSAVRPRQGIVAQHDVPLDAVIADGGGSLPVESIRDEAPTPEERCVGLSAAREVRVAIRRVRPRIGELGWDIVENRLSRDMPDTLEQIGRRWGVSRERVRQVELATREVLRRSLQPLFDREAA
jgi:RNA polymerase primary sigma factor